MNDSSIGAIRFSASSQLTRGGRGSRNASATSRTTGHLELGVVATLYARLGRAVEHRGDRRAREIVGVDVVRVDIVVGREHRRAVTDALERQRVSA
jgi:hypothetical protein